MCYKKIMAEGSSGVEGILVMKRFAVSGRLPRLLGGYGAAVLGVALTSLCIGLVKMVAHVENISLAYLLVVLWLAVCFGRGPAILASILAFLSYDFFFIPPTGELITEDPTQWISLLGLLATALVIGHLTATVQAHAAAALASQQHTARLYELAKLIASTPDQEVLLQALVQRAVQSFAAAGVSACALILPDGSRRPQIRASAPSESVVRAVFHLADSEQAALIEQVLQHGLAVDLAASAEARGRQSEGIILFVPLLSGPSIVGALGIAGTPDLRRLVPRLMGAPLEGMTQPPGEKAMEPQAKFFAAFCGQIALALEQIALRQAAIHAEALRESNRLKNALLESVTHDLRTPLAAIKAATSSLLEPGMIWREEQRGELIDAIDTSVDRLSHLVRNLLDLSRLEAGAAEPAYDWHFIGDLIEPVLEQLDLAGQLRDRQVVLTIPDTIPLVPLDHEQIERVLINLLENAVKYSPPGSVIQVQASVVGEPPELEVAVSDQGIGIPASELEAIFEKFYRVPGERLPWANAPLSQGAGLGLAICSNILRAHRGRIWAESRLGEGSTFRFTLPIPPDHPEGALPELEEPVEEALTGANQ